MAEFIVKENGKIAHRRTIKSKPFEFNVWKCVEGYEGVYQVSMDGKVRRIKQSPGAKIKELTPYKREGYLAVRLFKEGKGTMYYTHRLVAETFIPNPKNKPQVNHKDGNKKNPKSYNLEWVTNKENCAHAKEVLGIDNKVLGKANGQSKLTEADVIQIRASELKYRELASIFKVGISTIAAVKLRLTWKYVP